MSEKESVEQLAERIACNDVGGNYKSLDVERVTMSLQDFLRSHNIDPATMQPMDNGEKGCPTNKYETAWLIEAQNRIGGIPIWYAGLGVFGVCVGKHNWTTAACNAQRFESKQDAETFIRLQGFDALATEHGFDSTTAEELQEGRDYAEIDVPTKDTPAQDVEREIAEFILKASGVVNIGERRMDRDKFQDWLEENIPRFLKPLRDEIEQLASVSNQRLIGLEEYRQKSLDLQQQLAETEAKLKAAEKLVKELEHVMGLIMRRAASIANDAETYLKSPPTSAE